MSAIAVSELAIDARTSSDGSKWMFGTCESLNRSLNQLCFWRTKVDGETLEALSSHKSTQIAISGNSLNGSINAIQTSPNKDSTGMHLIWTDAASE